MKTTVLLHADEIARVLDRLACQIMERHGDCEQTVLLGIQRRGVDLAVRLGKVLEDKLGRKLPFGTLDINLYRDDWTTMHARPTIGESNITTPLDNKNVILVDDVLFTGRTIRAALEAILDYGRPKTVELLVLVDRGHRELPIHGDYVGRKINTARSPCPCICATPRHSSSANGDTARITNTRTIFRRRGWNRTTSPPRSGTACSTSPRNMGRSPAWQAGASA